MNGLSNKYSIQQNSASVIICAQLAIVKAKAEFQICHLNSGGRSVHLMVTTLGTFIMEQSSQG